MNEKSNAHFIEEVTITRKITSEDVMKFAALSGDTNPLHINEQFAKNTRFKQRVVHGAFLASLFSQVVGIHLGTPNVLYISQTCNFRLPVFIDETIQVHFKLKHYSNSTKIATYVTEIIKEGQICVNGEAKVSELT